MEYLEGIMSAILTNPTTMGIILGAVIFLFVFQIIILLRIRSILQQISFYIESISRFFYRVGIRPIAREKQRIPQTCQFCKHRMSFIHMSENKGEVEDFYYKCQLRNAEVGLEDTCEKFKPDNS